MNETAKKLMPHIFLEMELKGSWRLLRWRCPVGWVEAGAGVMLVGAGVRLDHLVIYPT